MSIMEEQLKEKFETNLRYLKRYILREVKDSILLEKVNQIKRFESPSGEYMNLQNPDSPFPYNFDVFKKFDEFDEDRSKLIQFIDDVLEEQTRLNINRVNNVYLQPLSNLSRDISQFLTHTDYYISKIPADKKNELKDELSELKLVIEKLHKVADGTLNNILKNIDDIKEEN